MKTILVVDDEPKIVQLARDYLEHAGFAVSSAADGKSALAILRSARPDLSVLDLGLPQLDGLDVTRSIRKESNVPIIIDLHGGRPRKQRPYLWRRSPPCRVFATQDRFSQGKGF